MSIEWIVISDLQYPYTDMEFVDELIEYIKYAKPNQGLLCVGDELDSPQPSRWSKGLAEEYEGTLQEHIDGCHEMMARFRAAIPKTKEFHVMRSNHGDRIQLYLEKYAPALSSLRALDYPTLLGYEALGITYHDRPLEFAPGWHLAHGDEGSLSRLAGRTAANLAEKWGSNVVIGHTHRLGSVGHSVGVNSDLTTRWGVEVGHMMDVSKADYLNSGSADWQQGYGVVTADGSRVTTLAVPREGIGGFR